MSENRGVNRDIVEDLEGIGPVIFGLIWSSAPIVILIQWFVGRAMNADLVPTWAFWWTTFILTWVSTAATASWVVLKATRKLRYRIQDLEDEKEEISKRALGATEPILLAVLHAINQSGMVDMRKYPTVVKRMEDALNSGAKKDFYELIQSINLNGVVISDPCLAKLWELNLKAFGVRYEPKT